MKLSILLSLSLAPAYSFTGLLVRQNSGQWATSTLEKGVLTLLSPRLQQSKGLGRLTSHADDNQGEFQDFGEIGDDFSSFNGELNSSNNSKNRVFMDSLQARISQLSIHPELAMVIQRDAVLPRQILTLTIANDSPDLKLYLDLLQERVYTQENPFFGLVGLDPLFNRPLNVGVQAEIVGVSRSRNGNMELKVRAGRRFQVLDTISKQIMGSKRWTQRAPVEFLNESSDDETASKRAMKQAKNFRQLVDQWLSLARNHLGDDEMLLDEIVSDLGKWPGHERPSECAFWVGALLNDERLEYKLAKEFRGLLLQATNVDARTDLAMNVLKDSIQRLEPEPVFAAWYDDQQQLLEKKQKEQQQEQENSSNQR